MNDLDGLNVCVCVCVCVCERERERNHKGKRDVPGNDNMFIAIMYIKCTEGSSLVIKLEALQTYDLNALKCIDVKEAVVIHHHQQ